jgi:tetratricopeptide (TPR) repeat protein
MLNKTFQFAILALSALLLGACAQLPENPDAQGGVPEAAQASGSNAAPQVTAKPEPKGPELPKIELTDRIMFELLVAEIAGQRGNIGLSVQTYIDLARRTRDPRIAHRATEVAIFARNAEAATIAATLWVETDPDSLAASQALVGVLVNSNQLDKAKPVIARLLAADAKTRPDSILQLSRLLARAADKDAALALVRELVQPYDNLAASHFTIAQAALTAQHNDVALEEARAAEKIRPEWELAVLLEAQILQQDTNAASIERLRTFLKAHPKSREIRMTLARLLVGDKQYADARAEFQTLQELFPDDVDVIFAIGILSVQLNDVALAERNFKRLLTLDYRDKDSIHLYLGQIEEDQKHYKQALAEYDLVTGDEHFVTGRIRYASVLAKQGHLDDARKYLQNAEARSSEQRVQLILAEAQLLREANQVPEAFAFLAKKMEEMPDQPDLLYDYAMLADKLDRVDILEASLQKLIVLKPDYAHAYNALGYSLAERNVRLDEALKYIDKALQLAPDDAFIIDSMGWVQYRLGHYDDSLKFMRRAYVTRPDPDIAAHLGEVLWTVGKQDEAKRIWADAAKKNPDNEALLSTMKRFTQ